jgi:hypothetical protein
MELAGAFGLAAFEEELEGLLVGAGAERNPDVVAAYNERRRNHYAEGAP